MVWVGLGLDKRKAGIRSRDQETPVKSKVSRKLLFFGVLAALLVAGLGYWLYARQVAHTGYASAPTVELTWALILASRRSLGGIDI